MSLLRDQAVRLLADARQGTLQSRLARAYATQFASVNGREFSSWRPSLTALLEVLDKAGLGDTEVLLEHTLPRSSLRVDAIVCGHNPASGRPSYVFVELKRWTRVHEKVGNLFRLHRGGELKPHPATQVRDYCRYVQHSIQLVAEEKELVSGIAYLHDASRAGVSPLHHYEPDRWGRMYTGDELPALLDQLNELLDRRRTHEENEAAAERFLRLPVQPSAHFIEITRDAVRNRSLLPLVHQQRAAYQLVEDKLRKLDAGNRKTVVIVVGGPGSGKSAIAVTLLGNLEELGMKGFHATGSRSFTETLRRYVDPKRIGARNIFKYNNNFREQSRPVDVIVSDEAHRLRRSSTSSTSRRSSDNDEPQIRELIRAAHVPVFLLDENQRVRADDVGSVAEITRVAHEAGCEVEVIHLRHQFRCGGSAAFDTWVDRLLGITDEPPVMWSGLESDRPFEVHVGDGPRGMENWIKSRKREGQIHRVTAGFCWNWPYDYRAEKPDIIIGDWRRWWNFREEADDGPEHTFWATDPRGSRQVGCVYTAQGFEYDWAGVIFGKDLVWRTDKWIAQPQKSFDSKATRNSPLFPELVRNAYRVLLTRGMRGVTMCSVDPETQRHLRAMVGQTAP